MAVTDEAILRIKDLIIQGDLKPGDRLPSEAELATRFGLSRGSLREAVRALSLVKVLDVRQGAGTYVTSLEPDVLLDAVSFLIDFHRDDRLLHILGVRRVIEPTAAAMATTRISDELITTLRDLTSKASALTDVEKLVAYDLEFHRLITVECGNPVLASLVEQFTVPTTRARVWRGLAVTDAIERTIQEHTDIVDAIALRDPALTQARCAVHVAGVEAWLRQAL